MRVSSIGMPAIQAETTEFINADQTGIIKPGIIETVNIKAPLGYIYEIIDLSLIILGIPAGGTSGTHSFTVRSETESILVLFGQSVFGTVVQYLYGHWYIADNSQLPPNDSEQQMQPRGKRIDATNGIDILYFNNTDANQAWGRAIRLWVRKVKVAT